MTTFANLRASAADALASATKTHDFVMKLLDSKELASWPADVAPASDLYSHGYCGDAALIFADHKGSLETLLNLLKPEPVVALAGSDTSVKPASHIRENEKVFNDIYQVAPVFFKTTKTGSEANWWTRLSTGHLVQVTSRHHQPNSAGVWTAKGPTGSHNYVTGHTSFNYRALRDMSEVAKLSSLTLWSKEWREFGESQDFTERQLTVLNVLRHCCVEERTEDTRARFGTLFSSEQGDVLWAFIDKMAKKFAALKPETEKEVEKVHSAIRELFALGTPQTNSDAMRIYLQFLTEKSGMQVDTLSFTKMAGGKGLDVMFQFKQSDDQITDSYSFNVKPRHTVELLKGTYSETKLRTQAVPVTYAD